MTEDEIIDQKVNVEKLVDGLDFVDEDVFSAALKQPTLFKKAIRYRTQKLREKNRAESRLDMLRSRIYLQIKSRDSEKKTESHIKELINRNDKYKESVKEYNKAHEYEEFSKLVLAAYEMKMQSMRIVSNMLGQESNVENRMKRRAEELKDTHNNLKRKFRD